MPFTGGDLFDVIEEATVRSFDLGRQALLHGFGAVGGVAAAVAQVPLPWIVGPMIAGCFMALVWKFPPAPPVTRISGQLLIGAALGLTVTPAALLAIVLDLHLVIGAALATIAISLLISLAQIRAGGMDLPTAIFGSIPGGPAEMAQFADKYGGDPSRVALSQTLRIMTIVIAFPALLALTGHAGFSLPADMSTSPDPWNLLGLLGAAAVGAALASFFGVASPAFLGSLLMVGVLAAGEFLKVSMPASLAILAQILIGVSIGSRFRRSLLQSGWKLLVHVTLSTAALLAGCIVVAGAVAWLMQADFGTMVLANAPGSMPEMAMTARALDLDSSVVVAFHVARVIIVMTAMPFIYRWAAARVGWRQEKD